MEWWIDVIVKIVIVFMLSAIINRLDALRRVIQEHHPRQPQQ